MERPVSIPLLVQRAEQGLGPRVPLRNPVSVVLVEGLVADDFVRIHILKTDGPTMCIDCKGEEIYLDEPIPEGVVLRAELVGIDSVVSLWLQ